MKSLLTTRYAKQGLSRQPSLSLPTLPLPPLDPPALTPGAAAGTARKAVFWPPPELRGKRCFGRRRTLEARPKHPFPRAVLGLGLCRRLFTIWYQIVRVCTPQSVCRVCPACTPQVPPPPPPLQPGLVLLPAPSPPAFPDCVFAAVSVVYIYI
jgi:hypothetical protein